MNMMKIDIKYLNKTCRDDKICAFYIHTRREKKRGREKGWEVGIKWQIITTKKRLELSKEI